MLPLRPVRRIDRLGSTTSVHSGAKFCLTMLIYHWLAMSPSIARAQFGAMVPGLTVTASESVPVAPESLRLVMKVQASGKDAKAAIKALNEQKENVRKALAEMNAKADSIRFSANQVDGGMNSGVANMMRSMRMRGPQFGDGDEEEEPDNQLQISTAHCMVTSQWALPAKEGDALALLPAMLRQQIATRDLEGKKLKPELEAEQMELFEQMAKAMQQQMSYGGEEQNAIRIEYIAQVSAEVTEKAHAKAFDKAKAKAKMLSDASGVALGKLYTVTAGESSEPQNQYYNYARGLGQVSEDFLGESEGIVAATSVDGLKHTVSVWLTFHLE